MVFTTGFTTLSKQAELTEVLLNAVENVHAKPAVHHVDRQPSLAKSPSAPDPVQVRLVVRVSILVHG